MKSFTGTCICGYIGGSGIILTQPYVNVVIMKSLHLLLFVRTPQYVGKNKDMCYFSSTVLIQFSIYIDCVQVKFYQITLSAKW